MNTKHVLLIAALATTFLYGCTSSSEKSQDTQQKTIVGNPPAEGFNAAASDAKAIAIADEVMEKMGGRTAWDTTRYIAWNFFGRRTLVWDKHKNRVRIDMEDGSMRSVLNMDNMSGRVEINGEELSHPDSVNKYLERTNSIWINDSYWLVMPFKLKDSGVTLQYLREDTTKTGLSADVLQLTFENVGNTPENKYEVFVDQQTRLVSQWSYFPNAQDTIPRFTTPWQSYAPKGGLMLSGDRGQFQLTDIQVFTSLPEEVFTSLAPIDLSQYPAL